MSTNRILFALFSLFPLFSFSHNESRIGFIENKNQFHENVLFQAEFSQYTVFLEQNRFTFLLQSSEDLLELHDVITAPVEEQMNFFVRGHAYRMNFIGANPNVETEKNLPHNFTLNYFIGNNPQNWA